MKKIILFLILISFSLILVNANTKENVTLVKCVDGDTAIFNIQNTDTRVRFLGIDTPESVKPNTDIETYGKNASEYTCNKLTNAKEIVLEYDDASDIKDKYDRTLAWVWVDNSLLEEDLLELGYAKIKYLYGNYLYIDQLYEKENIAKGKKIGLWSDYVPIKYTVIFKDYDKEIKIVVNENEKIEKIIPTKPGYKFIGWYSNNNEFDFNTRITSNITLTAKYEMDVNILETILIIVLILTIYLIIPKNKYKEKGEKIWKITN